MNKNVILLSFMLVVPSVWCSSDILTNELNETPESSGRSYKYKNDLKFLYNTYQECSNSELSSCLKMKLIEIVDRVARAKSVINVVDGISFVKDSDKQDDEQKSLDDIKSQLPRSLEDKERALNNILFNKLMSFVKGHTLQVKLPTFDDTDSTAEARGNGGYGGIGGGNKGGFGGGKNKDKKNGHWIMIPLLLGSTLVPLAFGALALLAGKALIVSKLALALASIIGIKKLISGSGHHHEAAHEVVVSGGHGSGWGRIGNFGGQSLAYNAYNP